MKNLLIILLLTVSNLVAAQAIADTKVKGEVWQKMESENFIFYFQSKQKKEAIQLMKIAEESFQHSSNLLGFLPSEKVEVFIYDLMPKKKTRDITVVLDHENHQKDMNYAINLLLLEDMMGKKAYKKLPEWFTKGAAAFATTLELNRSQNMQPSFTNLEILKDKDARATGVKIWHYIANQYGREDISDLLNLSRILEDAKEGISKLWGISYQEFLQSLTRYYKSQS